MPSESGASSRSADPVTDEDLGFFHKWCPHSSTISARTQSADLMMHDIAIKNHSFVKAAPEQRTTHTQRWLILGYSLCQKPKRDSGACNNRPGRKCAGIDERPSDEQAETVSGGSL